MLTCPACAAVVEPGWHHCGSCGAELPAAAAASSASGSKAWFDWQRPTMLLGALVVLLLLAGLSMAGAERRLDRRDDQLASTRQTLKETRDLLGAVRGELADRVKERDGLKADLDKAKGSLSDAQHSVESQSAQLKTLKDCLNAIEDVGVALDRGDDAGARAALDRADRSCSQAEAYL